MSIRKMCAVLAVLSALTVLLGVYALVTANKATDGVPSELASLAAGDITEGRPVTLTADKVLPYVCYISETENEESGHRYRYYPVQYRTNPAKFVLVCVSSDRFADFEELRNGAEQKLTVEGYLRPLEARTKAAQEELIRAMAELNEDGEDYTSRFLTVYVEETTLRSSALQRDIGWILLIGGLVMGAVGVIGFFAFRVEETEE